jgi:hypothetical protein
MAIHKATVTLESISPYSQSKYHQTAMNDGELHDAYEERTWRNKMSVGEGGNVIIQPMAFKRCLEAAAKYLSMRIQGQGKKTYTAKLTAGVMVVEPMDTGVPAEDMEGEWFHVPSDGGRSAKSGRVLKCFPMIPHWTGVVEFIILDPIITEDVMRTHIECMGQFVGVGRFRPQNGGYYGRFKITDMQWEEAVL